MLEGRKGARARQEPRPSLQKGGRGSLGSDSAVCVRRYGRGRRESSHDPVLSSGLDTDANSSAALPHRVNTLPRRGVELDMEAGEGGVDKYWMRLAANLGRMVQPWPTLRQLRYKLLTDLKLGIGKRKRAQNSDKKCTLLTRCISQIGI